MKGDDRSFGITLDGDERGGLFDWQRTQPKRAHWVQLELTHEAEAWLLNRGGIELSAFQALVAMGARPRCTTFDDGVLCVLRGVNLTPGNDPEDMVSVRMWIEPRRVVTVTPRDVRAVRELHGQILSGRGPTSPGALVVAIAARMLERLAPILAELDEETDQLQERIVTTDLEHFRRDLANLRRRLVQFRRHLAPQRDTLLKLLRAPGLFQDEAGEQLRELSERTTKHVEDVVAMGERCTVMHDEFESKLGERMNRNMQFMSLVAVMFLPLSFLTSLLGINVGGIPWADHPNGFWFVVCLIGGIVLFQIAVLRRMRMFRSL